MYLYMVIYIGHDDRTYKMLINHISFCRDLVCILYIVIYIGHDDRTYKMLINHISSLKTKYVFYTWLFI